MIKLIQNLLGNQKVICNEENGTIQRIKWQYIDDLNFFNAHDLSPRPLLHLYIYVIGLNLGPSYIFSLDKDSM